MRINWNYEGPGWYASRQEGAYEEAHIAVYKLCDLDIASEHELCDQFNVLRLEDVTHQMGLGSPFELTQDPTE